MSKLKYRQLHVDFHTGETFPNVAQDFSKEQFAEILKKGNIDSVNLFAKCHHGCFYYFDSKFYVHPNLKRDLLPEMVEVCESLGIDYYVYVSAGFDEHLAKERPDWLLRRKDASTPRPIEVAGYHLMCFNSSEYVNVLKEQVTEVCKKFPNAKGIFLDITDEWECHCEKCKNDYKALGLDEDNESDVAFFKKKVYENYYTEMEKTIHGINPDLEIFHNMGCVPRSRRDLLSASTHFEIEALPNGHWGFDYFPLCCAYVRNLTGDFVAHTARFHTNWGDLGGYKTADALKYETAWHNAFGSKSIIGEQLHPSGKFDEYTYDIIGKAYADIKKLEEYSENAVMEKEIAVFSQDYITRQFTQSGDVGASKILLQKQYLYDLIDIYMDFSPYKVIIFPDNVVFDEPLYKKTKEYLDNGGKILASGTSTLYNGDFAFDLGAKYLGENDNFPTFADNVQELEHFKNVKASMYEKDSIIQAKGNVTAYKYTPYAMRTVKDFSSHLYNTYDSSKKEAGATQGKDGEYFSWNIFTDFYKNGSTWAKEMVDSCLKRLVGKKKIYTNLPSGGIATLFNQEHQNRYVLHLLYGQPYLRGNNQVIEDLVPLYNVEVSVKAEHKIKRCFDAVTKVKLNFTEKDGYINLKVDKVDCHKVIVIEY